MDATNTTNEEPKMPTAWESTVTEVGVWLFAAAATSGKRDVSFGHIQGKWASGKTTYLPSALWGRVMEKDPGATVVHAVHNLDTLHAKNRCPQASSGLRQMQVCSYDTARMAIDRNLDGVPEGDDADLAMSRRVVFIVDLDLHCPADLALLFVSLSCLAGDAVRYGAHVESIRVVTMGSFAAPQYLRELCVCLSVAPLAEFLLPGGSTEMYEMVSSKSVSLAELPAAVKEQVHLEDSKLGGQGQHLVLCLGLDSNDILDIDDALPEARLESIMEPILEDVKDQVIMRVGEHVWVVPFPHSFRPRVRVQNFDSLHIAVRTTRRRLVFDSLTLQLCEIESFLSRDERLELLSWVSRTLVSPKHVYVYHCPAFRSTVQEYVDAGGNETMLDVANGQLSGFLAGLAGYKEYHWNLKKAISWFVTDDIVLAEALRQLRIQGIVRWEECPAARSPRMVVLAEHRTWDMFQQLLSILRFDARLAHFVSLGAYTNSRETMTVKAQLAILFTLNMKSFVMLDDSFQDCQEAATVCEGLGSAQAKMGTMWLVLGLWQRWLCSKVGTEEKLEGEAEISRGSLYNERGVCLNVDLAVNAFKHLKALQECLNEWSVPILPIFEASRGRGKLKADDTMAVMRDLQEAFCCQSNCIKDSAEGQEVYDFVSGQLLVPSRLPFDWSNGVREAGPILHAGVYSMIIREGYGDPGETLNWVCIPWDIVKAWQQRHGVENIRNALFCQHSTMPNFEHRRAVMEMEMNEDEDEGEIED